MLTPEAMLMAHTMGYAELLADLEARRRRPRVSRARRAARALVAAVSAVRALGSRRPEAAAPVSPGDCCTA